VQFSTLQITLLLADMTQFIQYVTLLLADTTHLSRA